MKKLALSILSFIFLLCAAICLVGCSKEEKHTHSVAATSISLDKTTSTLYVDEQETLSTTILPADTTDKTIVWSTSDTSVATVNNGVVTAIAKGTVTITAKCGNVSAMCTITVNNPDEDFAFTLAGNGYTLTAYLGNQTKVTTPSMYKGKPVTAIGERAFYDGSQISEIILPNTLTEIGAYAFIGCRGLTSITFPFIGAKLNGTENTHFGYIFGASSYSDNSTYVPSSLKTVIISNSSGVTSIGRSAFYGCTELPSVMIPDSVTSMGGSVFYACSELTSVTIGNGVTSIGNYEFGFCYKLTSITIGNSVTSIGHSAFYACSSALTSVTIPDNVTSIGENAFYGCDKLTSITIPDSITEIGKNAFEGCSRLKYNKYDNALYLGNDNNPYVALIEAQSTYSCIINEKCRLISSSAFAHCSKLTSVTIPDSVTSIGECAFSGCSGLASVTIPDSVTSIGDYAFSGCSGLTSVTIPNSVTSIGGGVFYGCSELTSATIPNSVTSIGDSAFAACWELEEIHFNGTMAQWNAISKSSSWNDNRGAYTIYCTDGNIAK